MGHNPFPDDRIMCHRCGFEKSCKSLVSEGQCRLWMQVLGKHPQTDESLSQWGCADEFLPLLIIENSQQQRATGAAVESFRNEMVKANAVAIALDDDQGKLIHD
jgi:hypothetical protein